MRCFQNDMRCFKLTLAYDGADFAGWQRQPDRRTVQGELERALLAVTGRPTVAIASGRTDAGVHALGQMVSVSTTSQIAPERLREALNAHLPDDIVVLDVEEMKPRFFALRDTVRKRYRYVIHDGRLRNVLTRRQAWHVRAVLDVDAMHRAAQTLAGSHDFDSFESAGSHRLTTRRTIFDIGVWRRESLEGSCVVVEVEADGFLYNMVRNITGTLVAVGRGKKPESWVAEVLNARDRKVAGMAAPPQGLFLVYVEIAPGLRLGDPDYSAITEDGSSTIGRID
ncbi:MAG: tRNA pseudouridine(38-40) synthase TruA [Pirellulales bacterium]